MNHRWKVIFRAVTGMFACCLFLHSDSRTADPIARTSEDSSTIPTSPKTSLPSFSNVFLIVEENHGFTDVVGNAKEMPYLNRLIRKYGVATQYFANAHPSLPNYLWLTTGNANGVTSNICGVTVTSDNMVRAMARSGVSWKAHEESLPHRGYLGCSSGQYVERHDPFAYLSDVQRNSVQLDKIVPFTEFATDLAGGTLPRFSFITPNLQNDAHDGTLSQADAWLKSNFRKLLKSEMFKAGGGGLLIIVFDEGTDNSHGGGRVPWIAIGPKVKRGYRSLAFYQHQSTLRLILAGLGVSTPPGEAASAPDMREFFR